MLILGDKKMTIKQYIANCDKLKDNLTILVSKEKKQHTKKEDLENSFIVGECKQLLIEMGEDLSKRINEKKMSRKTAKRLDMLFSDLLNFLEQCRNHANLISRDRILFYVYCLFEADVQVDLLDSIHNL